MPCRRSGFSLPFERATRRSISHAAGKRNRQKANAGNAPEASAPCQRFDRGDRSTVPEASRASRKPSGFRSKAASRPPPSNAGSERRHHRTRRRNAAPPFDRAPPVSLSGKPSRRKRTPERRALSAGNRSRRVPLPMIPATVRPWRPCAAGFRPMSPDSSRRVRNRWPSGLLSRQPFASRPPSFAGNAPQPPAVASARAGRVRARPAVPCVCKAV